MIVVDASVTLAWCFLDENDDEARRALDRVVREGAVAPAHWPLEVANGLRSAKRRGRIDDEGIGRAGRLLNDLGIEIAPVELSTALGTLETADAYDLSAYDALYLDLAWIRALPLATIDTPLSAACRRHGVEFA
jgi:predicted nucleic acid-binding protein